LDAADADHERCLEVLGRSDLELIVPALVVSEVTYLAGKRLGSGAEAGFLRGLGALEVEAPEVDDWARIADLVERYGDFPLGATDASIVVLAERMDTELLITLDTRHFRALRMRDGRPFRLLPE